MTSGSECLNLSFNIDVDHDLTCVSRMIRTFSAHILYIREQVPMPVSNPNASLSYAMQQAAGPDAQSSAFRQGARMRMKVQHRKLDKLLTDLNAVYATIEELCSKLAQYSTLIRPSHAYLLLGPSINSPKESYCLHFLDSDSSAASSARSALSDRQKDAVQRQIVRTLISEWNPSALSFPPTNLFLALKLTRIPPPPTGSSTSSHDQDRELHIESAVTEILESLTSPIFALKRGFKVRVRRRAPATVEMCARGPSSSNDLDTTPMNCNTDTDSQLEVVNSADDIWFVQTKGVKGIRCT